MESLRAIGRSLRGLLADKAALAIFMGLYALLLGSFYGFVAVREATLWQVLLTIIFLALVPVLFFILQAAIIRHASTGRLDWPAILRASTKLALVSIPVILVGIGAMWLLNRWQNHFPAPFFSPPVQSIPRGVPPAPVVAPTHWPSVFFAAARVFIFAVLLPLTLIRFWIEATRRDLASFFRGGARSVGLGLAQNLGGALSIGSIVTYTLGLILFAVIPYYLVVVHVPARGAWSGVALFTVRMIVVFALILFGWIVTVRALVATTPGSDELVPALPAEPPPPVVATAVDTPEMSAV